MMRVLTTLSFAVLLLSACGSEVKQPKKITYSSPQLNSAFVGNWQGPCVVKDETSSRSTIEVSFGRSALSTDKSYANKTCAGTGSKTTSTELTYDVLFSDGVASRIALRQTEDKIPSDDSPWSKEFMFFLELTIETQDYMNVKFQGGAYLTDKGTTKTFTAEEAGAIASETFKRL